MFGVNHASHDDDSLMLFNNIFTKLPEALFCLDDVVFGQNFHSPMSGPSSIWIRCRCIFSAILFNTFTAIISDSGVYRVIVKGQYL